MEQIKGQDVYMKVAESLPWEMQTALLTIREYQEVPAMLEKIYKQMSSNVYIGLTELLLITNWDEASKRGLQLTKAGKHIANFCTC